MSSQMINILKKRPTKRNKEMNYYQPEDFIFTSEENKVLAEFQKMATYTSYQRLREEISNVDTRPSIMKPA